MEKLESSEPKIEQYLAQIERYEKHPIVANVLAQETTFEREVECFYNLSTWLYDYGERKFNFGDEDSLKRGKYPIDLVEILGGFSEELFNTSKLQYGAVREDYQRWNKVVKPLKVKRAIVGVSGMLTSIVGGVTCVASAITGNYEIAVSAGVVGTVGLVLTLGGGLYEPKLKGTNNELKEYIKLHKSAERADGFIDKHYKNHFIKKVLSTK